MTVGAILLAAGSARRMGEDKLLADLGGKALALHALDAILTAGFVKPIVALAPGHALAALLDGRARIVEVADHAQGMGHSLAAAIAQVPAEWNAAIICLADMPFVRPATLAALARKGRAEAIVRPGFEGMAGNPVLWGCDYFGPLAKLTGDQGGRSLLERYSAELFECYDPGVLIDVDTRDSLEAARLRLTS